MFLIVDKSAEIRERIKNLIWKINDSAIIYESKSNEEAINIVSEIKPDFLITDIDLVDGSGLSLISIISRISPETKIVVFTNKKSEEIKKISLKIGADYFLSKANDTLKLKQIFDSI